MASSVNGYDRDPSRPFRRGVRVGAAAAWSAAAAIALTAPQVAEAAVYLVDFNDAAGAGGPGGTWNAYATPASVGGSLVDSFGGTSSLSIAIAPGANITDSTQPGSAVFNNTSPDSRPDWATSAANNGASGDYFFTVNSGTIQHAYTVVYGGLTAGSVINFDLLASRNDAAAKGFYDYSLDGGSTWTGFRVLNSDGTPAAGTWAGADTKSTAFFGVADGYTNHRYMNADGLTLTGGTLHVRVTDADALAATYSTINAMRLTTVVPEPGSAALLGLAAAAGMLGRRRRV
jgi:hypothetical protein